MMIVVFGNEAKNAKEANKLIDDYVGALMPQDIAIYRHGETTEVLKGADPDYGQDAD